VDQDDGGPEGDSLAAALLETIAAPVDARDGVAQGATAGLVKEGHAVCEAKDFDRLVRRQVATEDDPDFGLERVSGVDSGIPSQRRGIELGPEVTEDILETALD